MARIKCNVCGRDFKFLSPHLRVHEMTVREYLSLYPGSSLVSDEAKSQISTSVSEYFEEPANRESRATKQKEMWEDDDYRTKMSKAQYEAQKALWKDPDFRAQKSAKLLAGSNTPECIARKTQTIVSLNRDPVFRSERSKSMKELWKDPVYRKKVLAGQSKLGYVSSIHKIVSDYLTKLDILHVNEKVFHERDYSVRVDIYIPSSDKIIEVNGTYWHGRPGESMTPQQLEGFKRDEIKRELFGDRILFVWEEDIYSGKFKELIENFKPE